MSIALTPLTAARPIVKPSATVDPTVAKAAFKTLDWNFDGKLGRDEIDMARLGSYDANRDLAIDQAEFSTAFGRLAAAEQQAVGVSLERTYERPKSFFGLMFGALGLSGVGVFGLLRQSSLAFAGVLAFAAGGVGLMIESTGKRNLAASQKADVVKALGNLPQA